MNVIERVIQREMIKFKEKHRVESVGRDDFDLYSLYLIEGIDSEGDKAFYVGITRDFERRKKEHFNPSNWKKEESKHLYNALAQAQSKNRLHEFTMTEKYTAFSSKEILELEIACIAVMRKYFKVYNMTDGGEGVFGINGESHSQAVLTREQALSIGWMIENTTMTYIQIAKETGCNLGNVTQIACGNSWSHLFSIAPCENRPLGARTRVDDDKALQVIGMLYNTNLGYKEIAINCGVTRGVVSAIANGASFKHLYDKAPRLNRPSGAKGGHKRINDEKVLQIIEQICITRKTYKQISEEFEVTESIVSQIARGNNFKHLYDIPPNQTRKLNKEKARVLQNTKEVI